MEDKSKFSNTSSSQTNTFVKGMVKDVSDMFIGEGIWTHARNAIRDTHKGDKGGIGNEPANTYCTQAPYTVIGIIPVNQDRYLIFSTNNVDSEIGIFKENDCSYSKLVNSQCLNFKTTNLITGVSKDNYDRTISAYFADNLNDDRVINIDNIPYLTTGRNLSTEPGCFVPEYSNELDCDKLLLHPKMQIPELSIKKSLSGGQLPNGSYQITAAYTVNNVRVSDYFIPTTPQPLWSETGVGGSLDISVANTDENYDEMEVVMISVINQQTVARRVGYYSTRQKNIHIDQLNQSQATVDLALIPLQNPLYYKSEKIQSVNNYLLRHGVTTRPELNYQEFANSITTKWVEVQYSADYYYQGGNKVGYMRDEVYSFFIRWVYNTGHKTASYHIPGREASASDLNIISGSDVLSGETRRWEVQDTSSFNTTSGVTEDGGIILRSGLMSYWESSEQYPDNKPEIWGELCGKKIRHHKFPTNETTHIHSQGGNFINILGVKFEDIRHPLDDNGNPVKEIVGFEILRGSREGNKSIVAKGMFNNMFEYDIENTDKKGLYQNYPYNDLNPDYFLSTRLFEGSARVNDKDRPITNYKKDYFTFHSPDTTFYKPFLGENTIQLYVEQTGTVTSKYENPYLHPKHKLISNTSFATAAVVGLGIGLIASLGKPSQGGEFTVQAGFLGSGVANTRTGSRESGWGTAIPDILQNLVDPLTGTPARTAIGLALAITQGAFFAGIGMQQVLDIIYALVPKRNYALQLNSHGFYSNYTSVDLNHKRRSVVSGAGKYVGAGIQDFDPTYRINNLFRNKYVALKLNREVKNPKNIDNTRKRVNDLETWRDPFKQFITNTAAYYGALKVNFRNQYGQTDTITQIPVENKITYTNPDINLYNSTVLFGGDIYINRYTEKNPYFFFNQWLVDLPDEIEYNYLHYINGPFPRYWASFERYDINDLGGNVTGIKRSGINIQTPSNFHHLDRRSAVGGGGVFTVKNAYFYTFVNGVRDFFVESELNLAYREAGQDIQQKHYDPYGGYTDLSELFRSDKLKSNNFNKYDISLSTSKLYNNFIKWGSTLPIDYDPATYNERFEYYPDRVIYSLQNQAGLRKDNWTTFLANNYKDFQDRITSIKSINKSGAVILFEDQEPVMFSGVDELQTTGGVKVTIGDGGLFAQSQQTMVNADDVLEYASCQNFNSVVNTPFGLFWISQKSGKIFSYGGDIQDISRNGMKYWFAEYLPSRLLKQFPDFKYPDNPVEGVACSTVYDPQYELLYFSKKDYKAKENVKYTPDFGFFIHNGTVGQQTPTGITIQVPVKQSITLGDPEYFEDCSWTISYDPAEKTWVSFHDWHPDFIIPNHTHFFSILDNKIWKHNETTDLYANYYGEDYPWEVEFAVVTPNQVNTLRNIEYVLESYRHFNQGRDRHHLLDYNFDEAVIYNSEQISGKLRLNIKPKSSPVNLLNFPQITPDGINILYSKEENKFRFNQFWDVTRDRGEFTGIQRPIWNTEENGYIYNINPLNIDLNKPLLQRKKFRHYGNRVFLRRTVSNNIKMMLQLTNTKQLYSPR